MSTGYRVLHVICFLGDTAEFLFDPISIRPKIISDTDIQWWPNLNDKLRSQAGGVGHYQGIDCSFFQLRLFSFPGIPTYGWLWVMVH